MTSRRQQRISELLQEELGIMISAELTDPRLADALVSVTDVIVSADLRNAQVYVEHALPPQMNRQVLAALNHAASYLRSALAEHVNLRYVPELAFHIDTASQRGRHVDEILNSLSAASSTPPPEHNDAQHTSD